MYKLTKLHPEMVKSCFIILGCHFFFINLPRLLYIYVVVPSYDVTTITGGVERPQPARLEFSFPKATK